jgi:hypothetical protein
METFIDKSQAIIICKYLYERSLNYECCSYFDEFSRAKSPKLLCIIFFTSYSISFTDEKCEGAKNEDSVMSPFSKIDRGTQMSSSESENEDHSSPKSSSPILAMDQKSCHSEKLEIRDVQVDCQTKSYASKLSSLHGKELKKSGTEAQASGLDIAESTLDTSSSKYVR